MTEPKNTNKLKRRHSLVEDDNSDSGDSEAESSRRNGAKRLKVQKSTAVLLDDDHDAENGESAPVTIKKVEKKRKAEKKTIGRLEGDPNGDYKGNLEDEEDEDFEAYVVEENEEEEEEEEDLTSKKKSTSNSKKKAVLKKSTIRKSKSKIADDDNEDDDADYISKSLDDKLKSKTQKTKVKEETTVKIEESEKKAKIEKKVTLKKEVKEEKTKKSNGKVKEEEESSSSRESQKKKGKKVKEEVEIYKWWLEENVEEIINSDIKWRTLKHNGVMFPPEYEPHNIPVTYDGNDVKLNPEQEELATMYALMRETEYYNKPLFQKNFWSVWKEKLGKNHVIKDLKKCDFTKIWQWHLREKEKKLNRSKEEKKKEKEERDKLEEPYKWCYIDERKEKVGNFKVEPPGLFRGRGEHPKQGFLKKRVQPEDITINIGDVKKAPKPPKGHKWKEVISNNKVTWLACWKDSITGSVKYVNLASSSSFKGISDYQKYETAKELKSKISLIRKDYKKKWKCSDKRTKQLGVAMYFIDKLALRVGNEKDEEEADTVGCCSLRCEHINLKEPNIVEFDFLGKDSIRYQNSVEVESLVFKCLVQFTKDKKKEDNLFDLINSSVLNKELKQFMPKLTAKVFRTFNASLTLGEELRKLDPEMKGLSITEKLALYNKANREVAILCNHQRSVSKTHDSSISTINKKIEEQEEYLDRLKKAKKKLKKKGYDEVKAQWDKENDEKIEEYEKELKAFEERQKALEKEAEEKGITVAVLTGTTKREKAPKKPTKKALPKNEENIDKMIQKTEEKISELRTQIKLKEDNKTVALGTSRINYCDPRITVSWCKRHEVPVNKLFSKTLIEKFPWAMDAKEDYKF